MESKQHQRETLEEYQGLVLYVLVSKDTSLFANGPPENWEQYLEKELEECEQQLKQL